MKSLAGERIDAAQLNEDVIPGDRLVQVRGPEGVRTSRRHHQLLGLRGTLSPDGHALVNGHPWESAEARALVQQAAGDDAWLQAHDGPERFDILPLLVATDGALRAFGRDLRWRRRDIGKRFGGRLALNAAVLRGGHVRLGDEVSCVARDGAPSPPHSIWTTDQPRGDCDRASVRRCAPQTTRGLTSCSTPSSPS